MPLITKIDELKLFSPPANLGINESTFLPSFTHVEESVIAPELGEDMYDVLLASYQASLPVHGPVMSTALAALLVQVRKALAPLGLLHYKNSILSQISDAGSLEKTTDNAQPVRMWVNNLQSDTLYTEGMRALDLLLGFLEDNKGDYPDWMNGDGFTQYKQFILQTTGEFNDEVEIGMSRRFFKLMRPHVKFAELMILKKSIGEDFYYRLIQGRKDDSLSEDEIIALQMIFPVVANFAVSRSTLPIHLGSDGAYTMITDAQFSGQRSTRQVPDAGLMSAMKKDFNTRGEMYLNELKVFLNANASSILYAQYFTSDSYEAPPNSTDDDINQNLNRVWSF